MLKQSAGFLKAKVKAQVKAEKKESDPSSTLT
jgi:hypothetical protein